MLTSLASSQKLLSDSTAVVPISALRNAIKVNAELVNTKNQLKVSRDTIKTLTKIIYKQENGKVALIIPTNGFTIEQVIESAVPVGVPYLIINDEDIPDGFYDFHDAVSANFDDPVNISIKVDIDKAKEIAKDRIREERKPMFEQNDIALRDAMLSGNKVNLKAAIDKRDRLRDSTKKVDKLSTLQELREVKP